MRAPEAESEPVGRTQTWAQNHGADCNGGSCAFSFGLSLGSSTELNPSTQPTPRPTFTRKWEPGTQGSHCSLRWRTSDLAKRASCFLPWTCLTVRKAVPASPSMTRGSCCSPGQRSMGGGGHSTHLPLPLRPPSGRTIRYAFRSGSHAALPAPAPRGSRVKSQGGGEVVLSPSRTPILQGH